jgi:DNA-binding beta-propeller fold protein YncE
MRRSTSFCFASLLALVLISGSLAMMSARPALAASFAYVGDGGGGNINVIDSDPASPTFNTVVATIPNTPLSEDIAITPDGSRGYVINGDGTVSVLDTNPASSTFNTVVATVTPPSGPPGFGLATAMAITPNGSRAYTGSRWDPMTGNAFDSVIDTVPTSATYNTVVATIGTGFHESTHAIAITPDGSRAYMTGEATCTINGITGPCANAVEVVDTATNGLSHFFTPGFGPSGIAITPDGTRAYVRDGAIGQINDPTQLDVVDLSTNTVVATIPLPGPALGLQGFGGPLGLAITPDGNHAYVSASNQTQGLVVVVDTNPASPTYNTLVATIVLGLSTSAQPNGITITPNGTFAYVGVAVSSAVDVIATATNTVVATIPLAAGSTPTAVAITPAPAFSGGQLVLAPKAWDFGAVKVGTSVTRQFNIANGSQTQALQVDVLPATPNPPYSLVSGGGMATIGPGQSEKVVVQFKPTVVTATSITGSLPVTSSDPKKPSASIPLSGRGK